MINNEAYLALSNEGIASQGDLLIVKAELMAEAGEDIFKGMTPVDTRKTVKVVAHSETGHHHVLSAHVPSSSNLNQKAILAELTTKNPTLWRDLNADNPQIKSIVEVPEGALAEVVHMRENHTHATHIIPAGTWFFLRQQRPTPDGWTIVAD